MGKLEIEKENYTSNIENDILNVQALLDDQANIDKTKQSKINYHQVLNNLLSINSRDNAILTRSRQFNYDLKNHLLLKDYKKIFQDKSFAIQLGISKIDRIVKMLREINDVNEFLQAIDDIPLNITMTDRKKLIADFSVYKKVYLTKLGTSLKRVSRTAVEQWKKFRAKYIDIYYQTNVWPLYIASCFVRIVTDDAKINAPLFLKRVMIEIDADRKVYLKSFDDNIEINEKLIFILKNDFNINIPELTEQEDGLSFNKLFNKYHKIIKEQVGVSKIKLDGDFEFITNRRLKLTKFTYCPGATLSIISPSGGSLRRRFSRAIKDPTIVNNILKPKIVNFSSQAVEKMKDRNGLYRITPTDVSQELAIMGALEDHAIIWGPPGTGKSQTIANILANLLYHEKISVVTSEKKAALDVIKARMGKLAKFIFFGLVSKNMVQEDKKDFYRPFYELAKIIERPPALRKDQEPRPYINNTQVAFGEQKEALSEENVYNLIQVAKLIDQKKDLAKRIFHIHFALHSHLDIVQEYVKRGNLKSILQEQGLAKSVLLQHRYPRSIRNLIYAAKILPNDLNLYEIAKVENIDNVFNLEKFALTEKDFISKRNNFINDEDYLESILAHRFREKVADLRNNLKWREKINLFLRHAISSFRMPYKFISMHQEIIQELYYIFVSTPHNLSNFTEKYEKYAYVIFDEASQMHLETALPYICLSQVAIIAGDQQQMRPSNFFAIRDRYVDSELGDSLLDFAYGKNLKQQGREYMLAKNYRSQVGELMLFSSREFYNGKLDVIDNANQMHSSAIKVYNVDGKWEGRVNVVEAEVTLDATLSNISKYRSIIVLTLNVNQQQYLLKQIFTHKKYRILISLLEKGSLKLRNLENIQGDEAELVIVSVAYDRNTPLGATYVTRRTGGNALNVAISRAQRKMIVFKSLYAKDIKKVNSWSTQVFKNWLEYLEMNKKQRNKYLSHIEPKVKNDSKNNQLLIAQIFRHLQSKLYFPPMIELRQNLSIGSYEIDLAIVDKRDGQFLFGVEVVKYMRGQGFLSMVKDLDRRHFLAFKNYQIIEITEILWSLNPSYFVDQIQKKIRQIAMTLHINKEKERRR